MHYDNKHVADFKYKLNVQTSNSKDEYIIFLGCAYDGYGVLGGKFL